MGRQSVLVLIVLFTIATADFYFSGTVRHQVGSGDFGRAGTSSEDVNKIYFGDLDILHKPTYVTPSPTTTSTNSANFAKWFNTPFGEESNLGSYTAHFISGSGSTASWDSAIFAPTGSDSDFFTFEMAGSVYIPSTSATWTFTSRGGEVLLYVNGVRQTGGQMGTITGVHNTVTATITTAQLTGVNTGAYNRINVFYAYRNSNWGTARLAITLSENTGTPRTCDITNTRTDFVGAYPFWNPVMFGAATIVSPGPSNTTANSARLISTGDVTSAGVLWATQRIRVVNGFKTSFTFTYSNFANRLQEGFAFVIQSAGLSFQGGAGPQLGYSGIPKSVAIEFDTSFSGSGVDDPWPTGTNPVVVEAHTLYSGVNTHQLSARLPSGSPPPTLNIAANTDYQVIIEYVPSTGKIHVWIDTAAALSSALATKAPSYSFTIDSSRFADMLIAGTAYLGFTAANGDVNLGNIAVKNWRIWTTPVAAPRSTLTQVAGWNTDIVRGAAPATKITLRAFDTCNTAVPIGGDSLAATLFSDGFTGNPQVGMTQVADVGDGSYTVTYWHKLAEATRLFLVLNKQNIKTSGSLYDVVTFTPADIDAAHSTYTFGGSNPNRFSSCSAATPCEVVAGESLEFTITARDQFGNPNSNLVNSFSVRFAGDLLFAQTSTPPTYRFTGMATRALENTALQLQYEGTDIGTVASPAILPSQTVGTAMTPTPIGNVNVVAAVPPDVVLTAASLIGPGYSPGVSVGTTGTMFLTPIDQFGNPIEGTQFQSLTTMPTISFTCEESSETEDTEARCDAMDWTTSVVANNTLSQWVFTYNTLLAHRYILDIKINDPLVSLPGLAAVPVAALTPQDGEPLITADPPYLSGISGGGTFQARDKFDNWLRNQYTPTTTGTSFTVSVGEKGGGGMVSYQCDSGNPPTNNAALFVTFLRCEYAASGVWNFFFTPGKKADFDIQVSYSEGGDNTITVSVLAGPPYAPNCQASPLLSPLVAGETYTINVESRDIDNNLREEDDDTDFFDLRLLAVGFVPQGQVIDSPVHTPGTANYTIEYTTETAGDYTLAVVLTEQPISVFQLPPAGTGPFPLTVVPSNAVALMSTVTGPGVTGAPAEERTYFIWQSVDSYGNLLTDTADTFVVTVDRAMNGGEADFTPMGDGKYNISYLAPAHNDPYSFSITVEITSNNPATSAPVTTTKTILNIPTSNAGASDAIIYYGTLDPVTGAVTVLPENNNVPNLYDRCLTTSPSGDLSECSGGPRMLLPATAGAVTSFNLAERAPDFAGENRDPDTNYVVSFESMSGTETFQGTGQSNCATDGNDCFKISFMGTIVATYQVKVLANGVVESTESQNGVQINVRPGPLHAAKCEIVGFNTPQDVITAGEQYNYTIIYKDAYGNLLGLPADRTHDNTPQYTLQFKIRSTLGQDVTSQTQFDGPGTNPDNIKDAAPGDGQVEVKFRPTKSGSMRVYTYDMANGNELGAGGFYRLTVNPGPVARVCVGVAPTGPTPAGCGTVTLPMQTAGNAWTLPLFVQDEYGNPITNPDQKFNVTVELNGLVDVLNGASDPVYKSPGRYDLRIAPTKRVVHESATSPQDLGNLISVTALEDSVSNPDGDKWVADVRVRINPADVSEVFSYVDGIPDTVVAGTPVTPTLHLRDTYDNPWWNDASRVAITVEGPITARLLSIAAPGADGIRADNPNSNYDVQFTPTRATPYNRVVAYVPYTLSFKIDGATFEPSNVTSWNVTAGPPVPSKTIYTTGTLRPQDNWKAGNLYNVTLQLIDQYNNYLLEGGDSVEGTFLYGPPRCDASQEIIYTDYESDDFDENIVDNGDGRYTIFINTTRAGDYTLSIRVESDVTRTCPPSDTQFRINPLDIWPPRSVLTGPAVLDPRNNIAGETITFDIVMLDRYGNNVCLFCVDPTTCGCLASITEGPAVGPWSGAGSVVPVAPFDEICGTLVNTSSWIDLASGDIGATVNIQARKDDPNSTPDEFNVYRVTFQAQQARTWNLVVVVDTTGGFQTVGSECVQIEISPSYVMHFQLSQNNTLWAGIPNPVQIFAQDKFNNTVRNGTHFWESTVSYVGNNLLPYRINVDSAYVADTDYHELITTLHHAGSYSVLLELNDGANLDRDPEDIVAPLAFPIVVLPATCGAQNGTGLGYRCEPMGPCVADIEADCPGYSNCDFYCAGGAGTFPNRSACSSSACSGRCLAGTSSCTVDSNVATTWCSTTPSCPGTTPDVNPTWATQSCGTLSRKDSDSCPTDRVCPPGLVPCPDGMACVRDPADCFDTSSITCSSGVQCEDGRCVATALDCPTPVTCLMGSHRCPDGSCQNSNDLCPSIYDCYAPNAFRCQDGSCRASFADCPTRVTCSPGWVLCESGHCVMEVSACSNISCPLTHVRCPDGACQPTFDLCASGITCPPETPVLCHDRACVKTVSLCNVPDLCPSDFVQCPRGTCAPSRSDCPTDLICPSNTPVLCPNGECATMVSNCTQTFSCPVSRPFRCPDGSCANLYADCPTALSCPPNAPVRCASGGCVPSHQMCPDQMKISCGSGVRCPGGTCAPAYGECPTAIACQGGQVRCGDGSCRSSCAGVIRDPTRACPVGLVECPDYETGYSCASSYENCPQAPSCPPERPVRCADRSCRIMIAHCPPETAYSSTMLVKPCPHNTWSQGSCGQAPVCPPSLPVMCWDQSCRITARDCPPEPICTLEAKNPTELRPFLCPNGDCSSRIYSCIALSPCGDPKLVRCAGRFEGQPNCVDDVSKCADVTTATDQVVICPNDKNKCRDGSCRDTCPSHVSCPHFIPYLCNDGQCVRDKVECNLPNGCPPERPVKCSDGSCSSTSSACPTAPVCPGGTTLCVDGSCRSECPDGLANTGCTGNVTRCADKTCGDCRAGSKPASAQVLSNSCPGQRPYRCPNGYCAISSAYCTNYPQNGNCAPGKPIKCADGSCAVTSLGCPIIQPCPCPLVSGTRTCWVRCGDGSCAPSTGSCTKQSTICQAPYSFMCQNGLCAANNNSCINDRTGCPGNMTKCDNGECLSSCPAATHYGNGCPVSGAKPYKCWNGVCATSAAACAAPTGCNSGDPTSPNCDLKACSGSQVRCADGTCANPLSCTTAQGCPLNAPFRCVDGGCKRYPADGSTDPDHCQPIVMCSPLHPVACLDGTCVADKGLCPAYLPCPANFERCKDMTCRSTGTCPYDACPAAAPTLCPSGACVRSYRECGPVMGSICSSDAPFKCFDGSCRRTPLECVSLAIAVKTNSASSLPIASGVAHDAVACDEGEELCWNGACAPSAQFATFCPAIPSCPIEKPFRCPDGSCIDRATDECEAPGDCPTQATYPDGSESKRITRCVDGTCRKACTQRAKGCGGLTPLMCPNKAQYCFPAPSDSSKDNTTCYATPQEVCLSNCNRDVSATPQVVYIPAAADVTVDVAVDERSTVHTWIEAPAGAFGGATKLKITPVTPDQMAGGYTLINKRRNPVTYQQVAVGTPFQCQAEAVPGAQPPPGRASGWPVNITVWGNVDKQRFDSSGTVRPAVTTPCPWVGTFNLFFDGAAATRGCNGSVTFTETTIDLSFNTFNDPGCDTIVFKGSIMSVPVDTGDNFDVIWNITSSGGANPLPVGTQLCTSLNDVISRNRIYFYTSPTNSTCPPPLTADGVASLRGVPAPGFVDACAAATQAGIIDSVDICFGVFDTRKEFKCLTGFYERTDPDFGTAPQLPDVNGFRSWFEGSGRRSSVIRGRLSQCNPGLIYGFFYVPLPPPPTKRSNEETFWEKYGAVIISMSVIGVFLCFVLGYALSRLIRYRTKYKEEKKEAEELRQEATMMAETMGGLGVWDEEVQMVSNPLVLQFNEQKKKLDEVEQSLEQQEERDAAEMDRLDKERQMIVAEMNRLKAEISKQQAAKSASRDDAPPPVVAGGAAGGPSGDWGGMDSAQPEQHSFEPQQMGAKPKKRDL